MKNRKLRLDLDQLTVDSFSVAGGTDGAGTVHAHIPVPPDEPASDYDGVCQSYYQSCNGSCASCVNTCWNTCNASCQSCVVQCQQSYHSVCHEPATAAADGCW
jgi:hypothetical protein